MPPITTFDAAKHWATVPAHERNRLGALLLAYVVAGAAVGSRDERVVRASTAARHEIGAALEDFRIAFPVAMFDDEIETGMFPVPDIVGPVCEGCGCTENDACEGGCGWQSPKLCTSCAPGARLRRRGAA